MGGPSYEKPYPVKRSDGSQIIWDWNKREWVPYTPPSAPPSSASSTPPAPGSTGEVSGADAGRAPDGLASPGGASEEIAIAQRLVRRARGPGNPRAIAQRLVRRARGHGNPLMPGTSLLTPNRFGEY